MLKPSQLLKLTPTARALVLPVKEVITKISTAEGAFKVSQTLH